MPPKRKAYTEHDKKKFVDEYKEQKADQPNLSERQFAKLKGIPRTTFVKWLKVPDLDENSQNCKRRSALFTELESELYQWLSHYKNSGGIITPNMLMVKYQSLYDEKYKDDDDDDDDYIVCQGMIDRFRARFNLVLKRSYGECRDADWDAALNFKFRDMHEDFSGWTDVFWEGLVDSGRIWNLDETGLQYQQQSQMGLCRSGEPRDSLGRKLNKKRITFTMVVNCKDTFTWDIHVVPHHQLMYLNFHL